MTPTPEAARGAFRTLAERGWGQWGCGDRGFGGTDLFLQDPSCQDLPTWFSMLHYRQMYLSFTWRIGGPVTHTVYRKTRNEGKMKRGRLTNGGL